jgi:hypothetical protein
LNVFWLALRDENGYRKFGEILQKLDIPHKNYNGNLDADLPKILERLRQRFRCGYNSFGRQALAGG